MASGGLVSALCPGPRSQKSPSTSGAPSQPALARSHPPWSPLRAQGGGFSEGRTDTSSRLPFCGNWDVGNSGTCPRLCRAVLPALCPRRTAAPAAPPRPEPQHRTEHEASFPGTGHTCDTEVQPPRALRAPVGPGGRPRHPSPPPPRPAGLCVFMAWPVGSDDLPPPPRRKPFRGPLGGGAGVWPPGRVPPQLEPLALSGG